MDHLGKFLSFYRMEQELFTRLRSRFDSFKDDHSQHRDERPENRNQPVKKLLNVKLKTPQAPVPGIARVQPIAGNQRPSSELKPSEQDFYGQKAASVPFQQLVPAIFDQQVSNRNLHVTIPEQKTGNENSLARSSMLSYKKAI